jgi:hypothetical protein
VAIPAQPEPQLRYWQALATFGSAAVEEVLAMPEWRDCFPQIRMMPPNYDFLLPEEFVFAIATSKLCAYNFFADNDGKRLFAHPVADVAKSPPNLAASRRLSAAEALQLYGAKCLFDAVDGGVGVRDTKGAVKGK